MNGHPIMVGLSVTVVPCSTGPIRSTGSSRRWSGICKGDSTAEKTNRCGWICWEHGIYNWNGGLNFSDKFPHDKFAHRYVDSFTIFPVARKATSMLNFLWFLKWSHCGWHFKHVTVSASASLSWWCVQRGPRWKLEPASGGLCYLEAPIGQ